MLRQAVVLSVSAFDVGCEICGFQWRHNALRTPSRGGSDDERAVVGHHGLGELAGQGLARGATLHPDLVAALRTLHHPHRECYGWFNSDDVGPDVGSALAASLDDDAVLAVIYGDAVRLAPIRPPELPEALASALPRARPASIRPFSFAEADLTARTDGLRAGSVLQAAVAQRPHPAVSQAREILAQPRTGGGVLYIAARDQLGRRHRAPGEVSYFDTHRDGRVLTAQQTATDRRRWITFTPGNPSAIADQLRQLTAQVPPPRN